MTELEQILKEPVPKPPGNDHSGSNPAPNQDRKLDHVGVLYEQPVVKEV